MNRHCTIIQGSIGHDETAGDDGAYDLLDVEGTPEEVGAAIADSLRECDLLRGGNWSHLEHGREVFINVTVRVRLEQEVAPNHVAG